MDQYSHEFLNSINQIDATDWNKIFSSQSIFLSHEFLSSLEVSGSVCIKAGWQPHHLVLRDTDSKIVALVPLYIKTDSYGEYVFDWQWANFYARNGCNYYPKLVTAIPFTPCNGTRFGIKEGVNTNKTISMVVDIIKSEIEQIHASSWHCLFLHESESNELSHNQTLQRLGCQYHWFNNEYQNFDDFLSTFSSRKRKNLRKERIRVQENNIVLSRKVGNDISNSDWERFYYFYHLTYLKRSGRQGYLNKEFFRLLSEKLFDSIMMVTAELHGNTIASSLFFFDSQTLYGRYWGCQEEHEFLHFEACYYQGIEFAIERGLNRFDPGAQGEHKIQRGFTPRITYSNHLIAKPKFSSAIENFLNEERPEILDYCNDAKKYLPFKNEIP
jgi:predicted N-acyltransferase